MSNSEIFFENERNRQYCPPTKPNVRGAEVRKIDQKGQINPHHNRPVLVTLRVRFDDM